MSYVVNSAFKKWRVHDGNNGGTHSGFASMFYYCKASSL
jgi:hypothetical protein